MVYSLLYIYHQQE